MPRFESMVEQPDYTVDALSTWILVGRNQVLVQSVETGLRLPQARHARELGIDPDHVHFLGILDGTPVWAAGIDRQHDDLEDLRYESLFTLYQHMDEETWALAGRAVQIAEWHRTHRFCGRCAEETESVRGERARKCPRCGLLVYPRLSPAVITAVTRDDEILLARGRTFGTPMYSVLAGFVEPGESLEECVAREVKEEVGVEITDIRYHSSQPWPFPNSLMIGFTATWVSGDISIQESELVDAQWYRASDMPNMPGRMSIARRLIDSWLATQR